MNNKPVIRFAKATTQQTPGVKLDTKTGEDNKGLLLAWPIDPYALYISYNNSYLLNGIVNKIASSINSGFEDIKDKELETYIKQLNVKQLGINILTFGNAFFEIVKTAAGMQHSLKPIKATTITKKSDGSYQYVGLAGAKTLGAEEVWHPKLESLASEVYGDSIFNGCVQQTILLQEVDKYYTKLFQRGLFNPILLADTNGDMTDEGIEALQAVLQDQFRGVDNLQTIGFIQGKYDVIELVKNMDTKAFIEYRNELIKSIAVGMNIPYSMLVNDNSNKATSSSEYEVFLNEIIVPLQKNILDQLKTLLITLGFNATAVEELAFKPVDTKNELDEMRTWTGYKNAGIITANEVRQELGYDAIENGDTLETRLTPEQTKQNLDQINNDIQKLYS